MVTWLAAPDGPMPIRFAVIKLFFMVTLAPAVVIPYVVPAMMFSSISRLLALFICSPSEYPLNALNWMTLLSLPLPAHSIPCEYGTLGRPRHSNIVLHW